MQNGKMFQHADHTLEYLHKTIGTLATHEGRIKERLSVAREYFDHIMSTDMPAELTQYYDEIRGLIRTIDEMSEDDATRIAAKILNFADMFDTEYRASKV